MWLLGRWCAERFDEKRSVSSKFILPRASTAVHVDLLQLLSLSYLYFQQHCVCVCVFLKTAYWFCGSVYVCVQDCGGAPLCYLTESHTQVGAQSTQIWLHKTAANRTNFDEKSLEDILTWDQWWTCIPVRPTPSTALYMLGLVGLAARPASLALCANWSKQTAQGAMDPKLPRRSAMKVRALISETIGLPEIDKAATKMTLTGPTTCSLNPSRRNYLLAFNCLAVFSYLNLTNIPASWYNLTLAAAWVIGAEHCNKHTFRSVHKDPGFRVKVVACQPVLNDMCLLHSCRPNAKQDPSGQAPTSK